MTTSEGSRRLDQVLAAGFLDGLEGQPLTDVRAKRDLAEQEEADLSYLRRLVQGRIDILRAELERRSGGGTGSLVDDLPQILAEGTRGAPHGMGRHSHVEPSRADEHRRYVESLVADVDLADVTARSEDELREALRVFEDEERELSTRRRALHGVLDRCSGEIARRYRDGEADVADLLASTPPPASG